MLTIRYESNFKKDFKRIKNSLLLILTRTGTHSDLF